MVRFCGREDGDPANGRSDSAGITAGKPQASYIIAEARVEFGFMSTAAEQRQNRRCPVAEGANAVTVRIGTETYQGDLLNVSAEGYAVVVRDMPVPRKDLLVELECMTGRHEARVTRWERIDGMIRLGLHRVRDLLEEPAPEPLPEEKLMEQKQRAAPESLVLAVSFCVLMLAIAAIMKFGGSQFNFANLLP